MRLVGHSVAFLKLPRGDGSKRGTHTTAQIIPCLLMGKTQRALEGELLFVLRNNGMT